MLKPPQQKVLLTAKGIRNRCARIQLCPPQQPATCMHCCLWLGPVVHLLPRVSTGLVLRCHTTTTKAMPIRGSKQHGRPNQHYCVQGMLLRPPLPTRVEHRKAMSCWPLLPKFLGTNPAKPPGGCSGPSQPLGIPPHNEIVGA